MDKLSLEVLEILSREGIIGDNPKDEDLDLNLFENNMLDSINIVELIAAFEEKFNIEFSPDDILGSNWYNANMIIKTIRNKIDSA